MKTPVAESFFYKVSRWRLATLLKTRLQREFSKLSKIRCLCEINALEVFLQFSRTLASIFEISLKFPNFLSH